MKKVLNLLLLSTILLACSQQDPVTDPSDGQCLTKFTQNIDGKELYGYRNDAGTPIAAQYIYAQTDTLCEMAIVYTTDGRWIGINPNNEQILVPYVHENTPDVVEEGLFRIVEDYKLGFANLDGDVIIAPVYDFVTPFVGGYAQYYIGGSKIYDNGEIPSTSNTSWTWGGDIQESGYLNKQGQRLKERP